MAMVGQSKTDLKTREATEPELHSSSSLPTLPGCTPPITEARRWAKLETVQDRFKDARSTVERLLMIGSVHICRVRCNGVSYRNTVERLLIIESVHICRASLKTSFRCNGGASTCCQRSGELMTEFKLRDQTGGEKQPSLSYIRVLVYQLCLDVHHPSQKRGDGRNWSAEVAVAV